MTEDLRIYSLSSNDTPFCNAGQNVAVNLLLYNLEWVHFTTFCKIIIVIKIMLTHFTGILERFNIQYFQAGSQLSLRMHIVVLTSACSPR